eukprot:CAMPEP_0174834236 /NCGR_PEP_ID=MMETSP1114-20130205/4708_1 /TAXON_ID=312471 /ORGANISM="Neobodo designis, Strain CCAP 1951/1" /LENGTH=978 /DNA_ID=CAMNT_0016068143 /DNA_START=111 /DNA_END=3044 /DNA_ORIENTATION=-
MQLNAEPCLLAVAFVALDVPPHRSASPLDDDGDAGQPSASSHPAPRTRVVYDYGRDADDTVAFAVDRITALGLRSRGCREPTLLLKPDVLSSGIQQQSPTTSGVGDVSVSASTPTGPDAAPTVPGKWSLLVEVPVPAPVKGSAASSSSSSPPPPCVFGVVTLSGQRVRSVGGFLAFAAAAYARELALKPPPKDVNDVAPPSDACVSALVELASNPARPSASSGSAKNPLSATSMQKTTLFGTGFAAFGSVASAAAASVSSGHQSSESGMDPVTAAVVDAMPHADVPLDDALGAFGYDGIHTVLSVLVRASHSVAFVAATPTQAAHVAAACVGLMYPLVWPGPVRLGLTRADEAIAATADPRRPAVVAATHDVVPALVSGPGRGSLWIADCQSGLVAPAVPTVAPVELLPHGDYKLKDRWKRAVQEAASAAMASGPSAASLGGSSTGSLLHHQQSSSGAFSSGASARASCEAQSALLLAACDLFVDIIGGFRKCVVPRGPESHINLNSLLARSLGLVGSDPNPHGAALLSALVASPALHQWSAAIAQFNDIVTSGRAAGRSPAAMAHRLYAFGRRCGDKSPDVYPELASESAKKSAASPFGAISSFMRQAKTSVRSTVSSAATCAPAGVGFVRVGGRDARGVASSLGSGGSSVESVSATSLVSKSAMRAGIAACKPLGLPDLPRTLPATERAFVRSYNARQGDFPAGMAASTPSSSSSEPASNTTATVPEAVAAAARRRQLSWDCLGHFSDYHMLVAPAAVRGNAQHTDAFRLAVKPTVAAGSFAVVTGSCFTEAPTAGAKSTVRGAFKLSDSSQAKPQQQQAQPQEQRQASPARGRAAGFSLSKPAATASAASSRLRGVLDLSHMLGGGGKKPAASTPTQPPQPAATTGDEAHHADPFADVPSATPPPQSTSPAPAPMATHAFFGKGPTRPSEMTSPSTTSPAQRSPAKSGATIDDFSRDHSISSMNGAAAARGKAPG